MARQSAYHSLIYRLDEFLSRCRQGRSVLSFLFTPFRQPQPFLSSHFCVSHVFLINPPKWWSLRNQITLSTLSRNSFLSGIHMKDYGWKHQRCTYQSIHAGCKGPPGWEMKNWKWGMKLRPKSKKNTNKKGFWAGVFFLKRSRPTEWKKSLQPWRWWG